MQDLVDRHFPQATVVSVVLDNLHTHTPAALYATFPPAEACRIRRKVDFHDTPKHGSGLNMAEIECAVVSTPCLDRRLGDQETVRRAVAAWERARNAQKATVDWRFTTAKARRKLRPCLGNIHLTSIQSRAAPRKEPSMHESQCM